VRPPQLKNVAELLSYTEGVASVRRIFRTSEAALILLAVGMGIAAGLATLVLSGTSHGLQRLLYGLTEETLSAASVLSPWSLLALPIGGLLLGLATRQATKRWKAPIDVVEANALHGGAIPLRDTLIVCGQTLLSNGVGASVGLEAAYGQAGGGISSVVGRWLRLRRADMRILVGAGAGAAIGAAFNAPLTGAFYAFEIVIGAYTPSAIAPVAAACLSATVFVRLAGLQPYLIALPGAKAITTIDYFIYALLGIACAGVAIMIMRGVTLLEVNIRKLPIPDLYRPAIGGLFMIPLALITPQALSAGHGALHIDLGAEIALRFILLVFLVKILASTVSLGFGFRGGLFFASLFIGSLAGQLFAGAAARIPEFAPIIDSSDAALIGMAAMAVAIVGAPMTMSMLVLETTHDFALTSVAVTAGLVASTVVRETFGFSFSTWRMHTRGESIRSARDVGWVKSLTVESMMQKSVETVRSTMKIQDFRKKFPLGSTRRVVLTDSSGGYLGLVETAKAFDSKLDPSAEIGSLAAMADVALRPFEDIVTAMKIFDATEADDLAVVDEKRKVLGTLSERFVHRRYTDEVEKAQRELFGE
jgi:CIC family chloride channel protein